MKRTVAVVALMASVLAGGSGVRADEPVPPSPFPGVLNPYGPQPQKATVAWDGVRLTFSNGNTIYPSLETEFTVGLLPTQYTVVADPGVTCGVATRSVRRRFGGYYTQVVGSRCVADRIAVGGADLTATFTANT